MILLRDIIGHEEIIKALKGALASGRVAHAYLFSGPRGVGKMTAAMAFACTLMCDRPDGGEGCGRCEACSRVIRGAHPDVSVIRPEGATVKISQVRQMMAGIQFGPATGRWAVRIINDADTMTAEAANALLKTLEDPPPGVVFILVAAKPQAILPTVLSRCQHLYFQPLHKHQVVEGVIRATGAPEGEVNLASLLAGGSLGKAMELISRGFSMRDRAGQMIRRLAAAGIEDALTLAGELSAAKEEAVQLLDLMVLWFRDILLYNETGNPRHLINADRLVEIQGLAGQFTTGRLLEIIGDIELAKASLAASANVQLALEALFLRLAGKCPDVARREEVV